MKVSHVRRTAGTCPRHCPSSPAGPRREPDLADLCATRRQSRIAASRKYSAGTRRASLPIALSDYGWSAASARDPPLCVVTRLRPLLLRAALERLFCVPWWSETEGAVCNALAVCAGALPNRLHGAPSSARAKRPASLRRLARVHRGRVAALGGGGCVRGKLARRAQHRMRRRSRAAKGRMRKRTKTARGLMKALLAGRCPFRQPREAPQCSGHGLTDGK